MAKLSHEISVVKRKMECIRNNLGKTSSTILISIKFSNVSACARVRANALFINIIIIVIIIIENNNIIIIFKLFI